MKRSLVLLASLLAWGCTPTLNLNPEPMDSYGVPEPSQYPDAWGVYLDWETHYKIAKTPFWPVAQCVGETRRVFAILNEKAAETNALRIDVTKKAKLKSFKATIIRPDGETISLDQKSLRGDTVSWAQKKMKDEKETFERTEFQRKFLVLPAVEVGALIEIRYALESADSGTVCGGFGTPRQTNKPVLRYTETLSHPASNRYRIVSRNTESPPTKTHRDGQTIVTWTTEEFAGLKSEEFSLPPSLIRPAYSITHEQSVAGNRVTNMSMEWANILGHSFKKPLTDDDAREKLFAKFDLTLDTTGCAGTCLVDRALELARKTLRPTWKRGHFSKVKSLAKVVKKGEASAAERGLVIWKLLTDAGIEAKLALANGFGGTHYGLDAPKSSVFYEPIIFVPKGNGIESPIWIDPGCDSCARGQLAPDTYQAPVVVAAGVDDKLNGDSEWNFAHLVTDGERAQVSGINERIELGVSADGQTTADVTYTVHGGLALSRVINAPSMSKGYWKRSRERKVANRFPTATLSDHKDNTCDRAAGTCVESYKTKGSTSLKDGRIALPLSIWNDRANYFQAPDREGDIYRYMPYTYSDTFVVKGPEGFDLVHQPKATSVKSALGEFTLATETKDGKTSVTRTLTLKQGRFSAADYEALRAPVRAFVAARGDAIIFAKPAPPPPPAPPVEEGVDGAEASPADGAAAGPN